MFYLLSFLFLLFSFLSQANVKWLPDSSFNLLINYKNGKLPYSQKTFVFPDRLKGSVNIKSETNVNSLILPIDGEIVLDGSIILDADKNETNCLKGSVYYMEKYKSPWAQPDVWSSSKFNKATPDAEKIPCYDDVVLFPTNINSTVVVPDIKQFVKEIQIGTIHFGSTGDFFSYVFAERDKPFHFVFNHYYSGVEIEDKQWKPRSGCQCQRLALKIDYSLKECAVPYCVHPIKPIGHCKICGGYILFNATESFDIMEFKQLAEKVMENYGGDELEYHIGKLPENKVQLVIVDKSEYQGTSAQVFHAINYSIQGQWVHGVKYAQISGSPLSESATG